MSTIIATAPHSESDNILYMQKNELTQRLHNLEQEHTKGISELETLERRRQYLQQTLFRIQGALELLREFLAKESPDA